MANPFGNLKSDGLEKTEDRLGGGYAAKETDIYTGEIKAFYAGESSGGAQNVTVIMKGGDFGDAEYRETVYITSGKDKGQKNYYMVKDKDGKETGKKKALPGFDIANHIAQATVGKEISELDFEEKVMNIYDYEAKKEVPTKVMMATELLGQTVSLAIQKSTENQNEKDGNGNYVPKADGTTRDVNNIEKVFNTEHKMTVTEAENGATEPAFWNAWLEKNKGVTRDKTKKNTQGGTAGKPGGAPTAGSGGNAAPRTSLFGNKS